MKRLLVIALLGLYATGCVSYLQPRRRAARTTGTCPGACSHYLSCKGSADDRETYDACVSECRAIYTDNPQMLASYERLSCDDAVAFIEGDSGRGPGE